MVCTIDKLRARSWKYYLGLIRYYTGRRRRSGDDDDDDESGEGTGLDEAPDFDAQSLPGEFPGRWMGSACRALGVYGAIHGTDTDVEDIRRLYEGYHPKTGEPLVQNAGRMEGKRGRTPGWDCTFSAPKSVSVYYSTVSQAIRAFLEQIQEEAVRWAIEQAESRFAVSRVGRDGQHVPVDIVVATFPHHSSRALDVQLHTHCTIVNLGVDEKGVYRSLDSSTLFQNRDLLGSIYRARLAWLLQSKLGLELERDGFSFRIKGVPRELCDATSTRRKQIEQYLKQSATEDRIVLDGKAAAVAALVTRAKKHEMIPLNELLLQWQELNEEYGFTAEKAAGLLNRYQARSDGGEAKAAVEEAVLNLMAKGNHFSGRKFFEEVLNAGAPRNVSDAVLLEVAPKYLQEGYVTCLGVPPGETAGLYTTKEILKEERRLLDAVYTLRNRKPRRTVTDRMVDNVIAKRKTISQEQEDAVRHVLKSPGCIRLARGFAGVGKTGFVLDPVAEALEKAGYNVIAATPTGKTARVLESETGIDTDTITMRFVDFNVSFGWRDIKHHLRMCARVIKGRSTWPLNKPKPIKITPRTALIIDECGMVNTRQTRMIAERVARGGGVLILVGDASQITPVVGMSPFKSLCTRLGSANVRDIKRQREVWAREASMLFTDGKCGKALKMYADRGLLRLAPTKELAMQRLLSDWAKIGIRRPEDAAILVATNAEAEEANDLAQEARKKAKYLQKRRVFIRDVTDDQTYESFVHVGDRVVFTRNSKHKYKVQNGTFGTVQRIKGRRTLVVRVPDVKTGRPVLREIDAKDFPHIRRVYATTTHKYQGDSAENTLCLVGHSKMQDQPLTYVQASRARHRCTFYASEKLVPALSDVETSPLARQMERRPDLRLASDILEELGGRELDREAIAEKLLDVWEHKTQGGEHRAIIVPTLAEAIELNRRCQQRRIQDAVTRGTRRVTFDGHTFVVGDRIRFLSGCFRLLAREGDFATVKDVDTVRKTLTLQLDWAGAGISKCVTASLADHGHIISHGWVFTSRQEKSLNGVKRIYWDSFFRDHFWELRRHSAKEEADFSKASLRLGRIAGNCQQPKANRAEGHENTNNEEGSRQMRERLLKAKQSASELRSRKNSVRKNPAGSESEEVRHRRNLQANLLDRWHDEVQAEKSRAKAGLPERPNPYPALSDRAASLRPDGNDDQWDIIEARLEESILAGLDFKQFEHLAKASDRERETQEDRQAVADAIRQFPVERERKKEEARQARARAQAEEAARQAAERERQEELDRQARAKAQAVEAARQAAERERQEELDRQARAKAQAEEARRVAKEQEEERQARAAAQAEEARRLANVRELKEEEEKRARAMAEKEEARRLAAERRASSLRPGRDDDQSEVTIARLVEPILVGLDPNHYKQSAEASEWDRKLEKERKAKEASDARARELVEEIRQRRVEREKKEAQEKAQAEEAERVAAAEEARRKRWQKRLKPILWSARMAETVILVTIGSVIWVAATPYRQRLRHEEAMESMRRYCEIVDKERQNNAPCEIEQIRATLGDEGVSRYYTEKLRSAMLANCPAGASYLVQQVLNMDVDAPCEEWTALSQEVCRRSDSARLEAEQQSEGATRRGYSGGGSSYHSSDYYESGSSSYSSSQVDRGSTPPIVDYSTKLTVENARYQQALYNGAAGSDAMKQANPPTYDQTKPA